MMRSLIVAMFLCASFLLNGQLPQKNDNMILLITYQSPEDNYTNFGRYLIEEGYSFDISDKEFMILKTKPMVSLNNQGKPSSVHHLFIISFNDSIIKIKPKVEIPAKPKKRAWIYWQHSTTKNDYQYMYWVNNFKPLFENYPYKNTLKYVQE